MTHATARPARHPGRALLSPQRRASGVGREVAGRSDTRLPAQRGPSRMTTGTPQRALQALAEKWPDEATRALLKGGPSRMTDEYTRRAALRRWPGSGPTRPHAPAAQRAVQDDSYSPPRRAEALAGKWPDEATRDLLESAGRPGCQDGITRSAALQALAEKWPDEATRALLAQRAVQDDNDAPRRAALQALAEKWPDEATRASSHSGPYRMTTTLPAASRCRCWPRHGPTSDTAASRRAGRQGCRRVHPLRRASGVGREVARRGNMRHYWSGGPYSTSSTLLAAPRMQVLAEKWPDEARRTLLVQRAVFEVQYAPRRAAGVARELG